VEEVIGSVGGEIRAQRSRLEAFFHPISVISLTLSCSSGTSVLKDVQSNSRVAAKIAIQHMPVIICPSNRPCAVGHVGTGSSVPRSARWVYY
jgi:hypothetical protein